MQVSVLVLLAGAFAGGRGARVAKLRNSSAEPASTCPRMCTFGMTQCGLDTACVEGLCADGFGGADCSECLQCQVGTTPAPCEDRDACLEAYLRFGKGEACGQEWRNCQDCDMCQPDWCGDAIDRNCLDYYEQYGKPLTCERAECAACPLCGDNWCPPDVEERCIARYESIGKVYTCQSHSDCATCGVCADGYCPAAVEAKCDSLYAFDPERACRSPNEACLECPVCEPPNCNHFCLNADADPAFYCMQQECSGCPYCDSGCDADDVADCGTCKDYVRWYGQAYACRQGVCDNCCACG